MTNHQIPFDIKFEDKIFGGKLTLKQACWFLPPIIVLGLIFQCQSLTHTMVNGHNVVNWAVVIPLILLAIILAIMGMLFVFISVNGDALDVYILKKIKYTLRLKEIRYYK